MHSTSNSSKRLLATCFTNDMPFNDACWWWPVVSFQRVHYVLRVLCVRLARVRVLPRIYYVVLVMLACHIVVLISMVHLMMQHMHNFWLRAFSFSNYDDFARSSRLSLWRRAHVFSMHGNNLPLVFFMDNHRLILNPAIFNHWRNFLLRRRLLIFIFIPPTINSLYVMLAGLLTGGSAEVMCQRC